MGHACLFCHMDEARIVLSCPVAIVVRDAYPVSEGHTLIIPKRHIRSWFEANAHEQHALLELLAKSRAALEAEYHPDGYNIGINEGAAAGQTVPHLHMHLIPRYAGDRSDPRGGVRWVLPDKAVYWRE
jgi:diadenosine tetraphosphate (Ap4A) HIT family hydrolase